MDNDNLLGPMRLVDVLKERARQLAGRPPLFLIEVVRAKDSRAMVSTHVLSRDDGGVVARIEIN